MDNTSLDDFLDSEETGHENTDSEETGHENVEAVNDDIEQPTSRWTPDGRECAGCGATATRLWRDGERLVCPACKSWG